MVRSLRVETVVLLVASLLGVFTNGARGAVSVRVAAINPRCNYVVAGSLERQVRADARRSPGNTLDALNARQEDLNSILQQAQVESDILQNVCTREELPPVQNQLAGVIAWAYLLEADIAPQRFHLAYCDKTAATAPEALIASAWFALAYTMQQTDEPAPAPTLAPLVKEVMPQLKARAAAAGVTLPPVESATEYWRNNEDAKVIPCTPATP